jgi:hypothetical protein
MVSASLDPELAEAGDLAREVKALSLLAFWVDQN